MSASGYQRTMGLLPDEDDTCARPPLTGDAVVLVQEPFMLNERAARETAALLRDLKPASARLAEAVKAADRLTFGHDDACHHLMCSGDCPDDCEVPEAAECSCSKAVLEELIAAARDRLARDEKISGG